MHPAATDRMPPHSHFTRILLAIGALLLGMASYQCGAAVAKHLFPAVGAEGATAYRLGLAALILLAWRRPWRNARRGTCVRCGATASRSAR
ncbi:threonine/homoserine efflux transporter RhtA [Dokdonella fugitiva]|jgi:inner membrane transporter RhtA|nr:threonine/homoserine efflux transporter RhtA [Dokdonella fugitiva]